MSHLSGLPYSPRHNGHEFTRTTRKMSFGRFCSVQQERIKKQLERTHQRYQRRVSDLTSIVGETVVVETRQGSAPPRRYDLEEEDVE